MTDTEEQTIDPTALAEARAAYDEELALVTTAEQLSGRHVNTVARWSEPDGDEQAATITSIKHYTGWGLFGPTRWVELTVCYDCVHRKGTNCSDVTIAVFPQQELTVERNTSGIEVTS